MYITYELIDPEKAQGFITGYFQYPCSSPTTVTHYKPISRHVAVIYLKSTDSENQHGRYTKKFCQNIWVLDETEFHETEACGQNDNCVPRILLSVNP